MKDIQAGDFFFLPFKGKRRDLLVKAVQPHSVAGRGHWYVINESGHMLSVLLTSCRRCSPSLMQRITKTPNVELTGAARHERE